MVFMLFYNIELRHVLFQSFCLIALQLVIFPLYLSFRSLGLPMSRSQAQKGMFFLILLIQIATRSCCAIKMGPSQNNVVVPGIINFMNYIEEGFMLFVLIPVIGISGRSHVRNRCAEQSWDVFNQFQQVSGGYTSLKWSGSLLHHCI